MPICSWCGNLAGRVRRADIWGEPLFLCDECYRLDVEIRFEERIRKEWRIERLPWKSIERVDPAETAIRELIRMKEESR